MMSLELTILLVNSAIDIGSYCECCNFGALSMFMPIPRTKDVVFSVFTDSSRIPPSFSFLIKISFGHFTIGSIQNFSERYEQMFSAIY